MNHRGQRNLIICFLKKEMWGNEFQLMNLQLPRRRVPLTEQTKELWSIT